jgi:hypothetical protein
MAFGFSGDTPVQKRFRGRNHPPSLRLGAGVGSSVHRPQRCSAAAIEWQLY